MILKRGPSTIGDNSTANGLSLRFALDTRASEVNAVEAGGGKILNIFPWPTLKIDLAGKVIPRQARVIVGWDEEVVIGKGTGTTAKTPRRKTRQFAERQSGVQALWRYGTQICVLP